MRNILAEALIITLETALVLAIVAALGVPAGSRPKAADVSGPPSACTQTSDCLPMPAHADWSVGNSAH